MPTPPHVLALLLPTDAPDHRTALADLRAASCIAAGVALEDIHPASGHDMSLRAYLQSRAQWADYLARRDPVVHAGSHHTRSLWETHRPKYLADYPWPDHEDTP